MSIIGFFLSFPYLNYFFGGSKLLSLLGTVNVLSVIGVPLLALIMFLSKYIFKTRTSPNFKAGMWSFWIINIICLFGVGTYQISQFNSHSELTQDIDISAVKVDTLNIEVASNPYRGGTFIFNNLKISDGRLVSSHVHLDVEKAEGDQFELVQKVYARGRNETEAQRLASAITYDLKIEKNTITFPRIIELPSREKWRNQQISWILKVPEGKSIYLRNGAHPIAHHFDIDRNQEHPWLNSDQTWRMDSNGLVNQEFLRKSQRSEEFTYKDFDHLQLDGRMKVTIKEGEKYGIAMSGKPNYLDAVEVVQLDRTLNINLGKAHRHSPVRITITMPELKILDTNGTDDVKVQGFTQSSMRIKHRGRDELKVLAKIDSLYLKQADRSKVTLKGKGIFMESVMEKRTELDADRYSLRKAKINLGSYAEAKIAVSDSLWQYTEGGARVSVDGNPVTDVRTEYDHEDERRERKEGH